MSFLKCSKAAIQSEYEKVRAQFAEIFKEIDIEIEKSDEQVGLLLKYLYSTMPVSDIGNYPFATYQDFASHANYLYHSSKIVQALPEEIFLNYIVYHRVNEEEIRPCRSLFFEKLGKRIANIPIEQMTIEVNYWCAESATYQSTDDRTLSALSVYQRGSGRCGEESVFTVNAMRSAGIPARQVYVPKWSHLDDNHAWVEVYIAGQWYFLGACEPEEILNKGWFTNAASRAMMVHSRWFGKESSSQPLMETQELPSFTNELSRYAKTKQLTIYVLDKDGRPVADAQVSFGVLNYAEFATIAAGTSDSEGRISLETGQGSLVIEVQKDDCFAQRVIQVEDEAAIEIRLGEELASIDKWIAFDMNAPVDAPINTNMPTKEQKETGKIRSKLTTQKREEKQKAWKNTAIEEFLVDGILADEKSLFLKVLTLKDETDVTREVLDDHFTYAKPFITEFKAEVFWQYVASPRVEDEVLSPYREFINTYFDKSQQELFISNPAKIWSYIEKHIREIPKQERSTVCTKPVAALQLGVASEGSQKILFVAIARTLGIPARVRKLDGRVEFWQDGNFKTLLKQHLKQGTVCLVSNDQSLRYGQDFTFAQKVATGYKTLQMPELVVRDEVIKMELPIGRYQVITTNRLPNGNQFANIYAFELKEAEERQIDLRTRDADLRDMLYQIPIKEFHLTNEEGKLVSAESQTMNRPHIFLWLEEGMEPTEHILNEILEQKDAFANIARQITLILKSPEGKQHKTLAKVLNQIPEMAVLYDDFAENVNTLGRRLYIDFEKMPMFVVTNADFQGIFGASGYNVGISNLLLKLMQE